MIGREDSVQSLPQDGVMLETTQLVKYDKRYVFTVSERKGEISNMIGRIGIGTRPCGRPDWVFPFASDKWHYFVF